MEFTYNHKIKHYSTFSEQNQWNRNIQFILIDYIFVNKINSSYSGNSYKINYKKLKLKNMYMKVLSKI